MSALERRKSTSTTSYFESRVELTLNTLSSGAAGSRGTSLVCSAASKQPTCLAVELLTVKIRQPSHEFTFGVGISFIPYPLVLTPVV
jgi:hypothetical protein